MKRSIVCFFVIFLVGLPFAAVAGDEGLYSKEAPADAAFFRVFNASASSVLEVTLDDKKVATVAPLSVTGYGFSLSPELHFFFNDKRLSIPVAPESVNTLVWSGKDTFTVSEETFSSKKKARLKLFNVGAGDLALKTTDGKTAVIEGVVNRQYGYRDVNALSIPFSFFNGGTSVLTTEKITLKKGWATSLFLVKNGSSYVLIKAEEQR